MDPEQQPLLQRQQELSPWRVRLAHFLESQTLHNAVIALIIINACCVLADLAYTFLSDSCSPIKDPAPFWLEILSHISLGITTLFLLEIPPTLVAFGFNYYLPMGPDPYAALHLCDSIIIVTTFVLEVALKGRERELASLLVILRLWRLVKLVGGVAAGAGEIAEESLEQARLQLEQERANSHALRRENADLKARLANYTHHDA